MMARRWTVSEDTAVRLAAALDYERGGQRLRELAGRLNRTEAAVRQRAWRLRAAQLKTAGLQTVAAPRPFVRHGHRTAPPSHSASARRPLDP